MKKPAASWEALRTKAADTSCHLGPKFGAVKKKGEEALAVLGRDFISNFLITGSIFLKKST